jgi:REP element-mobilizing transposase RayT
MPQSLSKIILHIVFSTKNRMNMIHPDIIAKLHTYLAEACRSHGSEAYRVGGIENHIHIACRLPRTLTVGKLLEEIKKSLSAWIKNQEPKCKEFAWQTGYGAFSLGQSQIDSLIRYISRQKEHHQKKSFKEELLELVRKYKIEYNEQYLWD